MPRQYNRRGGRLSVNESWMKRWQSNVSGRNKMRWVEGEGNKKKKKWTEREREREDVVGTLGERFFSFFELHDLDHRDHLVVSRPRCHTVYFWNEKLIDIWTNLLTEHTRSRALREQGRRTWRIESFVSSCKFVARLMRIVYLECFKLFFFPSLCVSFFLFHSFYYCTLFIRDYTLA